MASIRAEYGASKLVAWTKERENDMSNKMFCVKLHSIEELGCLKTFFANGCPDVKWAYRGHSNYEWRLQPTIERVKWGSKNNVNESILEKENQMLRQFKELLGICRDDVDYSCDLNFCDDKEIVPYLAVMQHYEIPTRLLDFSWSIYVALYFASLPQTTKDCGKDRAIWALRLNPLEAWTKGYKEIFQKNTGCSAERLPLVFADKMLQNAKDETSLKKRVLPLVIEKNSPRMMAQRGLFVMPICPGHFELDLQETLGSSFNTYGDAEHSKRLSVCDILKMSPEQAENVAVLKMEFPDSINGDVMKVLKDKRITHETMFPKMNCVKCQIKREFWY